MASFCSDYLANTLIDFIFRQGSYTPANTLYIALLTTAAAPTDTGNLSGPPNSIGVEVSGNNYSRVAYNPSSNSNWENTQGNTTGASTGTTQTTKNSTAISFPQAQGGNWGTIEGVAVIDALTNGNLLYYGDLVNAVSISNGQTFTFGVETLQIILHC